jgi:hypothetical protein
MAANIQPIRPDIGFANWQNTVEHGLEGTSQSWKVGAPLVNASGYLVEATTGTSGYAGLIIGFALAPATGTTGADVEFVPALQGLCMSGTVDGTLSNSNAPGTGSVAQSGVWGGIGLQKDGASGYWYLCTTGTASFIVVGLIDAASTVNGRVRVQILRAQTLLI